MSFTKNGKAIEQMPAADTLEILDYLERRALRVGAIKPDEPAPKKPRTKAKADLAALHPEPLGEGGGL
jgi:hypothetical protein